MQKASQGGVGSEEELEQLADYFVGKISNQEAAQIMEAHPTYLSQMGASISLDAAITQYKILDVIRKMGAPRLK